MLTPAKFYKVILFLSMAVLSGNAIHNKPAVVYTDNSTEKSNITLSIRIRQYVYNYIRENEEELSAVRMRSARPFRLIDSVFGRYGLPREMKYLAVVESQLKATAVSRVGAKGPWQLMAVTAQELGLKVDSTTDERTHYYKSTVAAAKYLRDLHNEFGDWLLVLAAYNSGPAPVYRAIRKAGSRDFWALEKYLPAESRGHVKRFIASHYYFEGLSGVAMLTKSACETCTTAVGFATL
ncbi:MAG: lytic transglycosylase domain-containing protein [Chitinophagaceae bacterium]|nr:lytic transglycosylase domain-containing protein [Chitinophagaceae bacterium]